MNMKKMKMTMMWLLILSSLCLHLHASSSPKKIIHSIDTREEVVVHKSGVNPVVRHGGGGHGGGVGGHPGVLIPIYAYAGGHKNQHGRNNSENNSTGLPKLISITLALVLLLTCCC
ncbi:hypothetical protein HanPI659440_Chr13g0493381 [Helianthus annuus]|nr:hypothetical protein HanPI659440_Chr13g0493381 [Helianthus annuus]